MPIVRIEHSVPDFEKWKAAFDRDPGDRRGSGIRRYQVMRPADDPLYVLIDLEVATMAEAEAFVRTLERIWDGPGKAVTRNPRARILEVVESVEL